MSSVYLVHIIFRIKVKEYKCIYKIIKPNTTTVILLKLLKSLWWSSILKDRMGQSTEIKFLVFFRVIDLLSECL